MRPLLAVLALLLTACSGAAGRPVEARSTVERSGTGTMVTDRFTLQGDYRLDWTATDTGNTRVGCYHGANLDPGTVRISTSPEGGSSTRGSTFAYGLRGAYHLTVNSGCAWTVRFVPV